MTKADDYALQIALDRGLVRADAVDALREIGRVGLAGAVIGAETVSQLIASGALDARALARALAEEFGMPFVEIGHRQIDRDVLAALPRSFVRKHGVCGIAWQDDALQVAVPDPLDIEVLDGLAHVSGHRIVAAVAAVDDLQQAIARHYGGAEGEWEDLVDEGSSSATSEDSPINEVRETGDAPLIRLVHAIISDAVRRRASDIHLEPGERRFRVRYRIDGELIDADAPPMHLQPAIVSRLKIMANISIAEKRVPQDGRIQFPLADKVLDLRVSSLPTSHGESIVMRILDKEGLQLGLPELGFGEDDRRTFERLIAAPDGMLLVTGPTGSGKTTTLYGCLHRLNQSDRKIITVEDPVEYQLTGINQVPVRPEVGMTFAKALRAMLRQAPNIVMVGEIRDGETADIAIHASLTGHLVLSTLHTNDAPGAVTRLADMGAKPFLLAAALRATMAQRLVRRVCPHCREEYEPAQRELNALGLPAGSLSGAVLVRGTGCASCNGTGYFGRLGIFEIFLISDQLRELIYENASATRLRHQAREEGMRTMRDDGVRKVLAGLTTIEEVLAVTAGDLD